MSNSIPSKVRHVVGPSHLLVAMGTPSTLHASVNTCKLQHTVRSEAQQPLRSHLGSGRCAVPLEQSIPKASARAVNILADDLRQKAAWHRSTSALPTGGDRPGEPAQAICRFDIDLSDK